MQVSWPRPCPWLADGSGGNPCVDISDWNSPVAVDLECRGKFALGDESPRRVFVYPQVSCKFAQGKERLRGRGHAILGVMLGCHSVGLPFVVFGVSSNQERTVSIGSLHTSTRSKPTPCRVLSQLVEDGRLSGSRFTRSRQRAAGPDPFRPRLRRRSSRRVRLIPTQPTAGRDRDRPRHRRHRGHQPGGRPRGRSTTPRR